MPRPHHGTSASALAFVGACAALIVLLVPNPGRAADGYPRLGLYGHVNGQGAPIVTANGLDQALLDRIAARHMVVLDATPLTEYHPQVLDALRARNPQIKLIGYVQGSYAFAHNNGDPQTHLPTRLRNLLTGMNGYLYDLEGDEYDTANINLAKRDGTGRFVVAEAVADFFVDQILATGRWDGMYFDRFCQSLAWMQTPGWTVDHVRAGYPSFAAFDAGWQAGTDTLANRVRRRAGPNKVLIGNCGQGQKYAAFNGWMRENFPYQNGGTWQTNLLWPVGGYLTDEAKFLKPSAGWMTVWPAGSVTTPYTTANVQKLRMALASAALGDGYGSINPPDMDPMTGYMSWWYDEYAVNRVTGAATGLAADTGWLGQPQGSWKQMFWVQPGAPDAAATNPGFESNVTTGWAFTTSIGSTVVRDAATAGDGFASAKIHVPSASGNTWSTVYTTTGSVPYATDKYSATFWAKASVARNITVGAVNLSDTPYWMELVPVTTTWKRYQVTWTGQSGTAKLQFRLGGTAGDVWIDDVHFQRGAPNVYRRDFDYGTVLVNPSTLTYDIAMEKKFRRILGTQDPTVNDGGSGTVIRVRANDAVFLLRSLEELVDVDPAPGPSAGATALAWASVAPSPARAGAETVRMVLQANQSLDADVVVFDARGRRVRQVFTGRLEAGPHTLAWDGRDEAGRAVAPGLYFARARAGTNEAVRKIVCR